MNQVVLLGRICNEPHIYKLDNGKVVTNITIAVDRPFKNAVTEEYDTDFIKVSFWEGIATAISEYCQKGSIICARCRLQSKKIKINDTTIDTYDVVGELVSFAGHPKVSNDVRTSEKKCNKDKKND